jgi:diacylglycerol kinase (ATP)
VPPLRFHRECMGRNSQGTAGVENSGHNANHAAVRALLILNPNSGRARDRAAVRAAIDTHLRLTNADVEVQTCAQLSDLDALIARAVSGHFDAVVAVGGDGTVHEIARRLVGSRVALGIIPTGSGNGLARHLGIPTIPSEALVALTSSRFETVDTAELNGRPFFGVAGVGFDALVAHRFAASARRGLETYIFEISRSYLSYVPEDYTITVDGRTVRESAFLIAVANSAQYGNEAKVAPRASMQDGLFDVSIVQSAPPGSAPSMLRQLFEGSFEESPFIRVERGAVVDIERSSPGPAHVDGEAVDMPSQLRFTILPRSLRVLVPAGTKQI